MKRARVLVHVDRFVEALKGDIDAVRVINHALPADARVVDVAYIASGRTIAIDLESETYNEMPPKAPHPPVVSTPELEITRSIDDKVDG